MSGYKLSNIIIGMIIATGIVSLFVLSFQNISQQNDVSFSNETLEKYNQLEELQNKTLEIKAEEEDLGRSEGVFDILGDWFEQGYNALRTAKTSYETVDQMTNDATKDLNLGEPGIILYAMIGSILIIIIILGVIISTLTKREQ